MGKSLYEIVSEHKENIVGTQRATTEKVFQTGDFRYIEAYQAFVEKLYTAVEKGWLPSRIDSLSSKLFSRKYSSKKDNKGPYVNLNGAVELFKEADRNKGQKIVSDNAYRLRIRQAVNNGEVKVKKSGKRIKVVSHSDLIKFTNRYQSHKSQRNQQDSNIQASQFRQCVNLWENGNTLAEVGKKLSIPRGKLQGYWLAYNRHKK